MTWWWVALVIVIWLAVLGPGGLGRAVGRSIGRAAMRDRERRELDK